jgi:hypothetical protein
MLVHGPPGIKVKIDGNSCTRFDANDQFVQSMLGIVHMHTLTGTDVNVYTLQDQSEIWLDLL